MIVLCIVDCPSSLRGDLSKWLSEVNTGVYVGRLSAKVREELWERVCANSKGGQATMVYQTNNEQGYVFLTHNTTWKPVDHEGITLMQKPVSINDSVDQPSFLLPGFSKASKYEKARYRKMRDKYSSYVVVDVETTGLDHVTDRIIEIGLLKIREDIVEERFQCLIQSEKRIPDALTKLTGITEEMVEKQGISEEIAFGRIQEFIGDSIVVGYNIQFDLKFIHKLAERVGGRIMIKKSDRCFAYGTSKIG